MRFQHCYAWPLQVAEKSVAALFVPPAWQRDAEQLRWARFCAGQRGDAPQSAFPRQAHVDWFDGLADIFASTCHCKGVGGIEHMRRNLRRNHRSGKSAAAAKAAPAQHPPPAQPPPPARGRAGRGRGCGFGRTTGVDDSQNLGPAPSNPNLECFGLSRDCRSSLNLIRMWGISWLWMLWFYEISAFNRTRKPKPPPHLRTLPLPVWTAYITESVFLPTQHMFSVWWSTVLARSQEFHGEAVASKSSLDSVLTTWGR